jgi:type III secretion protein C
MTRNMRWARAMSICIMLVSIGLPAYAVSDVDRVAGPQFFFVTRGSPLREVLRDLASNYGLSAVVSPAVNDVFVGEITRGTPREVLQSLARAYGLAWYLTGSALYVYKAQEAKDLIITPTWLSVADLLARLRAANVIDSPFCQARELGGVNSIDAYGVPECLDRIASLVRSLDVNAKKFDQNDQTVQIFPLRYASANDTVLTFRDQQVSVPGVVTELRQMSQSQSLPVTGPAAGIEPAAVAATPGMPGMPTLPPLPVGLAGNGWSQGFNGAQLPLFSADVRQNAVIVRDYKANMPIYGAIIPQLDKRPIQIEISVDIIDVDAGDMKNLGVGVSGSLTIGGDGLSLNSSSLDTGSFSTVLGNQNDFQVRISALEQSARARILSRPSVVTLNNIQAVLDRNITFYTKLQGKDVAKLQSVAAGSLLRVTPRLIVDNGAPEIILTLDIQDGQQQSKSSDVESLPQVQNSSITTQAILKPSQSLLVGGFIQKEDVTSERRVPWLSSIPLVGALFRSRADAGQSVVRLFLIKARPLNDDWKQMEDVSQSAPIDFPPMATQAAGPPQSSDVAAGTPGIAGRNIAAMATGAQGGAPVGAGFPLSTVMPVPLPLGAVPLPAGPVRLSR